MNAALYRTLILGCIAIVLLELPGVISDWRFGDGFEAMAAAQGSNSAVPMSVNDNPVAHVAAPAAELLTVEATAQLDTLALHQGALEPSLEPSFEFVQLVSVPGL